MPWLSSPKHTHTHTLVKKKKKSQSCFSFQNAAKNLSVSVTVSCRDTKRQGRAALCFCVRSVCCVESECRCLLSSSRTAARVQPVSVHTNAARDPRSPKSQASSRTRPVTITMRRPLMKGLLGIYSDAGAGNAVPASLDAQRFNTDHKL